MRDNVTEVFLTGWLEEGDGWGLFEVDKVRRKGAERKGKEKWKREGGGEKGKSVEIAPTIHPTKRYQKRTLETQPLVKIE